jgi:uncharacterized repeat protein (TIGR01451 family)
MITLKFSVLAQYCCILAGLFLISAKNMETNEPGVLAKISVAVDPDVYDIILLATDNSGYSELKVVVHSNPSQIINDSMFFFVILPDGNYIEINQYSKASLTSNNFTTKVKLQYFSGTPTLDIGNMEAWLMKKNDPNLPPKPKTTSSVPRGESKYQPSIINPSLTPPLNIPNADTYINNTESIEIGTSWAPWDTTTAYYYLIISYTNRTNLPNLNGIITLSNCLSQDPTGFKPVGYFTYNADGLNTKSPLSTITNGAIPTFSFANLKQNEVRHIYVQMDRDVPHIGKIAEYQATIKYNIIDKPIDPSLTQRSPCTKILLSTAPHDPNRKIVDQTGCTENGTGMLNYYISFQNEGNDYAKNVFVYDQLPAQLRPYQVTPLEASHLNTFTPSVNVGDIKFSFFNINLPGSTQRSPQRYNYNETVGWVKFSCAATCPPKGQSIENFASIVFQNPDLNGLPGVFQDTINTDTIHTVADTILRPTWPIVVANPSSCIPKHCHSIGGRRCRLYFCLFRRCKQCTEAKPKK